VIKPRLGSYKTLCSPKRQTLLLWNWIENVDGFHLTVAYACQSHCTWDSPPPPPPHFLLLGNVKNYIFRHWHKPTIYYDVTSLLQLHTVCHQCRYQFQMKGSTQLCLDHPSTVLVVSEDWIARRTECTSGCFKYLSTAKRCSRLHHNGKWDSCKSWGEIAGI